MTRVRRLLIAEGLFELLWVYLRWLNRLADPRYFPRPRDILWAPLVLLGAPHKGYASWRLTWNAWNGTDEGFEEALHFMQWSESSQETERRFEAAS